VATFLPQWHKQKELFIKSCRYFQVLVTTIELENVLLPDIRDQKRSGTSVEKGKRGHKNMKSFSSFPLLP